MTQQLPALIVLIPLLMAAPVALLPARFGSTAWLLATIATGLGFLTALTGLLTADGRISYAMGGWPPPWGIEFVADAASLLVATVLMGLCFITTVYARAVMPRDIPADLLPRAYGAWLLAIGGLAGTIMTGDAFNLFVFFEIASLATVTLVALGARQDRRALIAAYNYLIVGAIGATFYVIGVGFCYALTGTLNMADMAARIPYLATPAPLFVGFAFMVAGVLVKAAAFPVHIWLPAAYGYAPSAVSAMLAAVATKASLCVFARIVFTVFGEVDFLPQILLNWVILPFSLLAMIVATLLAIAEHDLKRLLAQSSIAQIGYITLAFSISTVPGVAAGFIHIVNHALIKGGLFMAVGAMAVGLGKRVTMERLAGMGRAMPITASAMMVCGLSLIGLPLTTGFVSKVYLILALIDTAAWFSVALVVISSLLALVYLWRIVEAMWLRAPASPRTAAAMRENPMIYGPLWVLALGNIWFGTVASGDVVIAGIRAANVMVGG